MLVYLRDGSAPKQHACVSQGRICSQATCLCISGTDLLPSNMLVYLRVRICSQATCLCISGTDLLPSNMLVYLRDGSARTVVRAATLKHKLQTKLYLSQSQYTDTGPTSANFEVTGMTRPGKIPAAQAGIDPPICHSRGGRLNHLANEAVVGARRYLTYNKNTTHPVHQRMQMGVRVGWTRVSKEHLAL